MLFFPNAKINLGLNVVAKREDGYHDIETVFVPVPDLYDVLEVVFSERTGFTLYGAALDCSDDDNLCMKACRRMQEKYGLPPVWINLFKKIPTGAGLGGGSSDAAFTIKALNTLFNIGLSEEQMAQEASALGSDCPFFIYNRPMSASGRGEILKDIDIPALDNLEIKIWPQKVFVSTAQAYAGITPGRPEISLKDAVSKPVSQWKEMIFNDFEKSVFERFPNLGKVKEELYGEGALYASMTGSGSALYSLSQRSS